MISLLLSIGTTKQPTIVLAEENNIEQHTTSAQELEDYINFLELKQSFLYKRIMEQHYFNRFNKTRKR